MAYYYYYQQNNTSIESLSPETTATQLTPPPLLLLSPSSDQQLTLPLLTPILPSVTTSMSITTTAVVTEHHQQQQQLPTPNTFIKHCEDIGLFKDLQNVVVVSRQLGDTATTPAPVTATSAIVTTSAPTVESTISNLFCSPSTAVVKHMIANPFDETFKQAVLRQQKADANPMRNILNNSNNDNELNTPFIVPVTVTDVSSKDNNNSSTVSTSVDMRTTAVMDATIIAESMTTVQSQPEQQNMFITTSTAEATTRSMLMMMKEQQHRKLVKLQHQQNNHILEQQIIIPSTTTTPSVIDLTMMNYHDNRDGKNEDHTTMNVENGTIIIKQALKQNLLVKQMLRKRQKHQNNNVDVVDSVFKKVNNSNDPENDDNENQLRKQLQKQDLLERNRSAAKRCRIKRKQRWELLSEENRKLKIENIRLRDALGKLVNEQLRWTSQQQQQVQLQGKTPQDTSIKDKKD